MTKETTYRRPATEKEAGHGINDIFPGDEIEVTEDPMMAAFVAWWDRTHAWPFNPKCQDLYETHALRCFKAGWEARQ